MEKTSNNATKPIYTHTSLYVKDMDAAVKFYTEILGMKLIRRRKETPQDNAERAFLASDDGPYRIELTQPKTSRPNTEKLDHIAFDVENLDGVLEELRQKGVTIVRGPTKVLTAPIRIAFIKDNDGIMIELIEHLD
ncbi:MAG: VOC family protein [Nitrososphaeria archaeon]